MNSHFPGTVIHHFNFFSGSIEASLAAYQAMAREGQCVAKMNILFLPLERFVASWQRRWESWRHVALWRDTCFCVVLASHLKFIKFCCFIAKRD